MADELQVLGSARRPSDDDAYMTAELTTSW